MSDLEALDDDILRLLRSEKEAVPELASGKKAALFAAVASRVGLPVPPDDGGGEGNDGGGGGGHGGGGAPDVGGSAGVGASPGAAVSAVGQGGFALVGGKAVGVLLATLAIGMAAGAVIDRRLTTPPAPIVTSPMTAPSGQTVARGAPAISVEEPHGVPVGALPAAPTDGRSAAAISNLRANEQHPEAIASASSRGLAAERGLLDVARSALARGEANDALRAAERHASEYPNGALVEEREAIAIKALVALGRKDEARKRAAEMERRFPNGLMLRAVKSAVETAP